MCEACDPQHSATKVQAKATRFLLLANDSSFFLAISFHFLTLSATPIPDILLFDGNPQSVNLAARSSAKPAIFKSLLRTSCFNLTAAVSVNMLTTTDSTRSSTERTVRTRDTQPPHIIPVTSSRTDGSIFRVTGDCMVREARLASRVLEMVNIGARELKCDRR